MYISKAMRRLLLPFLYLPICALCADPAELSHGVFFANGTVLFDSLVQYSRFGGVQLNVSTVLKGKTLQFLSAGKKYDQLCALKSYDELISQDIAEADVLILPAGTLGGVSCHGGLGREPSGMFFKHWCAASKGKIVIMGVNGKSRNIAPSCKYESPIPEDCLYLFGRTTEYARALLTSNLDTEQIPNVSLVIGDDGWYILDSPVVQFCIRWLVTILYAYFIALFLRYHYLRVVNGSTNRMMTIITVLECTSLSCLCLGAFQGTSHCLGTGMGFGMTIFLWTEFFGMSTASDITLALLYLEITRTMQGNKQKAKVKNRTLGYVLGIAGLDVLQGFCVGFVFVSNTFGKITFAAWPFILVILQMGTFRFLLSNVSSMKLLLKDGIGIQQDIAHSNSKAIGSETSDKNSSSIARLMRLERTVRFSAYLVFIGWGLNVVSQAMFLTQVLFESPYIFLVCIICTKTSRLVNSYARCTVCKPFEATLKWKTSVSAKPHMSKHTANSVPVPSASVTS